MKNLFMPHKKILIMDTGKEWGGGTNSLLELLKRINKGKYCFTVLFYNNYKKGNESDIKTEIEKLGIKFMILEQREQSVIAKTAKELLRLIFFFSRQLKRYSVFFIDYHFKIKENTKKISNLLRDLKIDLLYMNNQPSSNIEGILAAKDAHIPSIQHSRIGAELNSVEISAVNNWLEQMICVSQGVKKMFVRQGIDASKCEVVYNGISPEVRPKTSALKIRKMLGVSEEEILIGTVSSLVKRKRINDLIEAFAELYERVKDQGSSLKCMIIGDGPEKENLQEHASKIGLKNIVIFTGFQAEAISYINSMDIFVLPSEQEGLPRVILEAMLMAKPVVACDITGPSELVVNGETGFLVPARKPELLADAILKLIHTGLLRERMGKMGKKRALEKFSMDAYIKGISTVFDEVIG